MVKYNLANVIVEIDGEIPKVSEWNLFSTNTNSVNKYSINICRLMKDINKIANNSESRNNPLNLPASIVYILNFEIYNKCIYVLIDQNVIHLHSSYIIYQGKAILFTGPSGVGKTTQAELWRDYQGAEIINGDVTLIRKWDGRYCAFGAPIHGSSPYCENKSAPIEALIVLQQGTENRIEVLNHYEALSHCLPEIYRPEMPEETQNILWETIDDFFSEMPVYRLTCRPDRESTEIVKEFLGL